MQGQYDYSGEANSQTNITGKAARLKRGLRGCPMSTRLSRTGKEIYHALEDALEDFAQDPTGRDSVHFESSVRDRIEQKGTNLEVQIRYFEVSLPNLYFHSLTCLFRQHIAVFSKQKKEKEKKGER